jgi:uncharacterized membrane protein YcaP (DUF421 family)
VGTIGLLVVTLSFAEWRWHIVRRVIRGIPVVLVRRGEVVEEALRLERLGLEDLLEAAREQGIDDLAAVKLAVLEPDGKFSFIKFADGEDGQVQPDTSVVT